MSDEVCLRDGERIDTIISADIRIIQSRNYFRFGTDAVLLSDFAKVTKGELVCELGTGVGAIAAIIAKTTNPRHVDAIEIQPELADMAQRTMKLCGIENTVNVHNCDLRDIQEGGLLEQGIYDCVICNPPYGIPKSNTAASSKSLNTAKFEETCTMQDVFIAASYLLKPGGRLCMIHLSSRAPDALSGMRAHTLEPKAMRPVYDTLATQSKLTLYEGRKSAGQGLEMLPPLIIRENGEYSDEYRRIYKL